MKNFTFRISPVWGCVLVLFFLQGRAKVSFAETVTAVRTGDWNNLSTWSGKVPAAADSVLIPANVVISIPNGYQASCSYLTLNMVSNARATSSSTRNLINLVGTNSRLTVSKDINIYPLAGPGSGNAITLNVGAGTVSCDNLTLYSSVSDSKDAEVVINGGILNITSTIKANDNQLRNAVRLSNAATLNIAGNWAGIGQMIVDVTSVVNIQGDWLNPVGGSINGTVNYNGINKNQQVGRADYNNLTIAGGGNKTVTTSATVAGLLSVLSNTILYTNDELRLLATATANSNIGPLANGAKILGNVFFQQFLSGGTRTFRSFSAPVKATYEQYKWWMLVTGFGGVDNGFDLGAQVNPDGATIKFYRESAPNSAIYPYDDLKNLCDSIPVGKGYYFYYRGNRDGDYKVERNPATGDFDVPEDVIMEFWGPINNGEVRVPLTKTNLNEDSDGYNMIGNPYPSTIDWNSTGITRQNIKSTIWTLKKDGGFATWDGTFGTNGGSNYLLPGQGFFVQVDQNSTSGEVVFSESAKTTFSPTATPNGNRLMAKASYETSASSSSKKNIEHLRLKVSNALNQSDETLIALNKKSVAEKTDEDALYFGGGAFSFASLSSDKKYLSINYMPEGKKDTLEIKLFINGGNGNYTLSVSDFETLSDRKILLFDAAMNKTIDLKEQNTYSFSINRTNAATYGSNRLKVIVLPVLAPGKAKEKSIKFTAMPISSGTKLEWAVSSGENNRHVELERSEDGKTFGNFATIKLSANDAENIQTYIDKNPVEGLNYYRLKAVTADGSIIYSDPISVRYGLTQNDAGISVYPNPAVNTSFVEVKIDEKENLSNNLELRLYDLNGRVIKKSISGNGQFPVGELAAGVYIVEAVNPGSNTSYGKTKLIKN